MVFIEVGGYSMENKEMNNYKLSEELDEILKIINCMSDLFFSGFSKLINKDKEILDKVIEGFSQSPIREVVQKGLQNLKKSVFNEDDFTALTIAVLTLQGSFHDALYENVENLIGIKVNELIDSENKIDFNDYEKDTIVILSNIRNWLISIAIGGFNDLTSDSLESFEQVLDTIETIPDLKRLSVLLRGMTSEFLDVLSTDVDDKSKLQLRWMDLWVRAYVLTLKKRVSINSRPISGKLRLISIQNYIHRHFMTIIFNGILENKKEKIYVEIELSKYLADLVPIQEFWTLFNQDYQEFFDALNKSIVIDIIKGELRDNSILNIEEYKLSVDTFNLLEYLKSAFKNNSLKSMKIQPIDRHTVHFKIPILVDRKNVKEKILEIGEHKIPLKYYNQLSIKKQQIQLEDKLFGEIRFDNGWYCKPLTFLGPQVVCCSSIKSDGKESLVYPVLKERSSKILRR